MGAVLTPTDQLISTIYVSSASRPLDKDEMLQILRASRRNNEKMGVSGMLLHRDGNFMQVLEGPQEAVNQLIATIKDDPRHHGFLSLWAKPITERRFAEWSMAFRDITGLADNEEGHSPFLNKGFRDEAFRSNPDIPFRLLLQFKENIR
jgi:hypothetical protein